jgi:hypothetical protein
MANRADATLRNVQASNRRDELLAQRLDRLEDQQLWIMSYLDAITDAITESGELLNGVRRTARSLKRKRRAVR